MPRRRFPAAPRSPRRFRRRAAVRLVAGLLLLVLLGFGRFFIWPLPRPGAVPPREARVVRVVDGDTLLLDGGERVRLLGVNTPETKHPDKPPEPFGREASEFTHRNIEGRSVRLEFDRERRDGYGRLLAYVYRDDGWFLNEELIRAGLSKAQTRFPYSESMKRRFRLAEQSAREHRRGVWSAPENPSAVPEPSQ